ncbi:MAG: hypothetical protein ACKVQA_05150 [Burkholderiales bacterium]
MNLLNSLLIWPDRLLPSLFVLLVIAMPFMYAARHPVHALVRRLFRAFENPLRLASRWLFDVANRLRARNREVLFAHGGREAKLVIDREFERVTLLVQRDLEGYPALQRKIMDEITRIEEDYKKSGEVPPPPPEWVNAIQAIAAIKATGDGVVEDILATIRDSLDKIYNRVVAEYRAGYQERHGLLKRALPSWRSLGQTMSQVERSITGLHQSAVKIDSTVQKLEGIYSQGAKTEDSLTASASAQFFIASLVMLVAIGGAYVNYKLISLPMSAMVGGGDYITETLSASEVSSMVIILFETLMGLFLMDAMRFTNLFPLGNLTEKMRRRMMWASLSILLVLAGFEVALAIMRDTIIASDVALKQSLADATTAATASGWVTRIPTFGQMVLGFTLPFALAFVAIPLEHFVSTGRIVLGALLVMAVRGGAISLRVGASLVRETGKIFVVTYDVFIFAPLAVERWIAKARDHAPELDKASGQGAA